MTGQLISVDKPNHENKNQYNGNLTKTKGRKLFYSIRFEYVFFE